MRALARLTAIPFICLMSCLVAGPAAATANRLLLASQQDFAAKRGFYLALECEAPGDQPCALSGLKLILGVGDGSGWRFSAYQPAWQLGKTYAVTATITPTGAKLDVDGATVAEQTGPFVAATGPVSVNEVPGWANGQAEYLAAETAASLRSTGKPALNLTFPAFSDRQIPLLLFESASSKPVSWQPNPAGASVLQATFRLLPRPDPHAFAPMIDRFGQARHADFAGKVTSDAELKASQADEERRLKSMPAAPSLDPFGGLETAGWREKATGFYRLTQHAGKWWLLTPEGNPVFYTGVCTAPALIWEKTPVTGREYLYAELPPRTGATAELWGGDPWGADPGISYLALQSANLVRRYGAAWQEKTRAQTKRRLAAWAFTGMGKWCDPIPGVPLIPVLGRGATPTLVEHPDVFDPAVVGKLKVELAKQIEPRKADPYVVGWSIGNEYSETIKKAETAAVLALGSATPAKRALVDYAVDKLHGGSVAATAAAWGVSAADRDALYGAKPTVAAAEIEQLRQFYEDRFYEVEYAAVKAIDPNHLYFGDWVVPGWWESEADWTLVAKHCDVVGYDNYARTFTDDRLSRLMKESNKPVLCGEFSFPPLYSGQRGYGRYQVYSEDDADAGRLYTQWIADAAENPYCVGALWFQYRDQPLTGRGPGHGQGVVYGEHYAFGTVDVTDRPKWPLVEAMRRVNLTATARRLRGGARR